MKHLLFVCAIWTGAYIDPSDGVGFGFIIGRYVKHLQERTLKVDCKGACNLKKIHTSGGLSGTILVKGLTMENDEETTNQFCTSDWSLASGPGYKGASQICKFDESVRKPTEDGFFLKLLCINWENPNQGCRFKWLSIDGDVYIKSTKDNYPWLFHDMKNITLEATCTGNCYLQEIRTHGGKTVVRVFNDEKKTDQFCTSDASSPDQICEFDGKPAKHSFFIELECVNKNQGCQKVWLRILVDGVVSLQIINSQWDLGNMAHGKTYTHKAVCEGNQCNIEGIIMTGSETGTVEINTYKINNGRRENICESNPGTVHCQEALRTGYYPETGPFFIEGKCSNTANNTQGCQDVAVTMTSGNVKRVHGPLN